MMRSLFSGVSGLRSHQTRMDVIGNNIANVNTTGYKSKSLNFSDLLYQTTQSATGPSTTTGGLNPRQIGLGVKTAAINTSITTEGATQSTGNPFDLKISGEAFFIVSDGTNTYYTRDGSFDVDSAGNLCMSSTGYIVQGWGVDANGDIVKGTVGNLNVMSKSTYDAAATTSARISGILDANDTDLQTENGYQVNVPIYDAKGYSYSLKFGILPTMIQSNGTKEIQNTAKEYTLPGDLYKIDTSELTYTYDDGNKTLASTASPELIDALDKAVWAYILNNNDNLNGAIDGDYDYAGGSAGTLTVDVSGFVDNYDNGSLKDAFLEYGDLLNATLTVNISGDVGYSTVEATSNDYPLSGDFAFSTISEDAVSLFYTNDALDTDKNPITVIKQAYEDDNGDSVTDYIFRDSDGNDFEVASNLISDVLKLLALDTSTGGVTESYVSYETKPEYAANPGSYTLTLLGMTDINGAEVDISQLLNNGTSSWDLTYNTSDGKFVSVGSDGTSFDLNLSLVGDSFSNVTIDMSDTTNQDNGKKSSLEGFKDDGRKVGTLTGVSIGTDGLITALYSNGMSTYLGQICVGTFANAMGLENAGDNLYQVTANSGDVSVVDIKASGTGSITTGALEMSNVDLSQEFTDMITTQRGFQANSRIITVSDTLLEELVNLKR